MKKMLAMVALATGLMLGSVANAAQVDIFVTQNSSTDWSVTVSNNGGIGVGAVAFLVTGLDVFGVNLANTGISAPDSTLSLDPLGTGQNYLQVNNVVGGTIAAAGLQRVLLGTLSGAGPVSIEDSTAIGSDTVLDANGIGISDFSLTIEPTPVPEPATLLMLGLGLAGLALVRRAA